MGSPGDTAAEKRARWRSYFAQQLTGGDAEIDAATEAAMRALERGADVNEIVAAGIEGARVFRSYGALPAPSAEAAAAPLRDSEERDRPAQRPGTGYGAGGAQGAAPAGISAAPATTGSATSGIVGGLQQRQETFGRTYFTVWNFRLERRDAAGNPLTPIPVEMRGRRFTGGISNGDLVDIHLAPAQGKVAAVRQVRNLTVGAEVKAIGRRHPVLRALSIVLALGGFAILVFFVLHIGSGSVP